MLRIAGLCTPKLSPIFVRSSLERYFSPLLQLHRQYLLPSRVQSKHFTQYLSPKEWLKKKKREKKLKWRFYDSAFNQAHSSSLTNCDFLGSFFYTAARGHGEKEIEKIKKLAAHPAQINRWSSSPCDINSHTQYFTSYPDYRRRPPSPTFAPTFAPTSLPRSIPRRTPPGRKRRDEPIPDARHVCSLYHDAYKSCCIHRSASRHVYAYVRPIVCSRPW